MTSFTINIGSHTIISSAATYIIIISNKIYLTSSLRLWIGHTNIYQFSLHTPPSYHRIFIVISSIPCISVTVPSHVQPYSYSSATYILTRPHLLFSQSHTSASSLKVYKYKQQSTTSDTIIIISLLYLLLCQY